MTVSMMSFGERDRVEVEAFTLYLRLKCNIGPVIRSSPLSIKCSDHLRHSSVDTRLHAKRTCLGSSSPELCVASSRCVNSAGLDRGCARRERAVLSPVILCVVKSVHLAL